MSAERIIITAEQAISCLLAGDTVHNFISPHGGMLVGCDYDRAEAVATLEAADSIEIAGPSAKAMKHAIVAHKGYSFSFFESDMEKIEALEAAAAQKGPDA